MPSGYGGAYRALGGCLAACILAGAVLAQDVQQATPPVFESQPEAQGRQQPSEDRRADGIQQNQTATESLAAALDKIEAAIRDLTAQQNAAQGQGPKDHEIRDLEAQEGMALWAKAMFWATVAAVIVTLAGVLLIGWTLYHTRLAAIHANQMAVAAEEGNEIARAGILSIQRPFISFKSIEKNKPEYSDHLHFRAIMVNTGHSVARRVVRNIEIMSKTGDLDELFNFPTIYSSKKSTFHITYLEPGGILQFPNIAIDPQIAPDPQEDRRLFVYGWVEYDDAVAGSARRRTEFCVELRALRGAGAVDPNKGMLVSESRYGKHNGADEDCYHSPMSPEDRLREQADATAEAITTGKPVPRPPKG